MWLPYPMYLCKYIGSGSDMVQLSYPMFLSRTLDMLSVPSDNNFGNFWVLISSLCQVLFTSLLVSCTMGEGACGKAMWPGVWLGALPEEFLGRKFFLNFHFHMVFEISMKD